jgi:hypothetical protein
MDAGALGARLQALLVLLKASSRQTHSQDTYLVDLHLCLKMLHLGPMAPKARSVVLRDSPFSSCRSAVDSSECQFYIKVNQGITKVTRLPPTRLFTEGIDAGLHDILMLPRGVRTALAKLSNSNTNTLRSLIKPYTLRLAAER